MNNIVVIGFMGSGKSTVGPLLAERLSRPFRDLDDEIVAGSGNSVHAIFTAEGEAGFRRREAECLARVLSATDQVVAVGGGAPISEDNWRRIRDGNCVIALTAEAVELGRRLNGSLTRPLLAPDPPAAIATLLPRREGRYLEADLVVATDGRAPAVIADDIARRIPGGGLERIPVTIPGATHEVVLGRSLCHLLAPALRRIGAGDTVVVVTDPAVGAAHAGPLVDGLRHAGFATHLYTVPAGETAKAMETLTGLYDRLAELRMDRDGTLVALGGGTVGDVTGFAAATWSRGIRYLQVPTTLLAMVDSSIGGKTAINLRSGKNLVGAIHQPAAIFCDLEYLSTLPEEEFRSGMAEVCKVGIIADRGFAEWLGGTAGRIHDREPLAVREAVARAVAIKASVVSEDPTETGRRAILNYGHTVGHGLERALGYGAIRHGEAVAWGMEVAVELSVMTGRCGKNVAASQRTLLRTHGLLSEPPRISRPQLLEAIRHDKKSHAGEVRWVLLRNFGDPQPGCRVEPEHLAAALDKVFPA